MEEAEGVEMVQLLEGESQPAASRRVGRSWVVGGLASCLLLFVAWTRSATAPFSSSKEASRALRLPSTDNFVQEAVDIAGRSANCTGAKFQICKRSPWVFCTDAVCEAPVAGIAKCVCWKQTEGWSVIPKKGYGAGCVTGANHGGEAMCEAMRAGKLYSTFSKQNTSYYPARAFIECPPKTPFAYCWGAPCVQHPDHAHKAICDCPMVVNPSNGSQFLTIEETKCSSKEDLCKETHNSNFQKGAKVTCLSFTGHD